MKKLVVLFLALLAFTSCKVKPIVGKWYVYSIGRYGKIEIVKYECKKDYIEFKSNGKIKGVNFRFEKNCEKIVEEGTYSIENKKLTITFEGFSRPHICTIKGNEMILVGKEGEKLVFKRLE